LLGQAPSGLDALQPLERRPHPAALKMPGQQHELLPELALIERTLRDS
jgi:hypothetical protein